MQTNANVHVQLENNVEEIAPALDRVAAFLEASGADENVIFRFRLALDELLTNSVMHGFPEGGTHVIAVDLRLDRGQVEAAINSGGVAFDPLQVAAPDLTLPVDERPIGGLGLYLVKELVPTLRYRRVGDRNVITLTSALSTAGDTVPGA